MTEPVTVASLRAERALTLQEFGDLVGLSKSQMHEVERTGRASLRVAIAIEELSDGRIDAAELCEDVRLARHGADSAGGVADPSTGQIGELSGPAREAAA